MDVNVGNMEMCSDFINLLELTSYRPCEMFCNPLEHSSVLVQDAKKIDANHMIVVYKQLKDNSVERRILQGPQLFMPAAEEWYLDFLLVA